MKAGTTMEELAAEIMRQKECKTDYIVHAHRLYMEPCGESLVLHVLDNSGIDRIEPLDIGDYAHRQIGAYLNIPAKYYSRMLDEYPKLLTENVNGWFSRADAHRMLRVLDGRMRAFVSNRYLRIDHHEVSCAVFPILGEIPDVQFLSCQMTESRMYIKLAHPGLQQSVGPDLTIQSALLISNSEIGAGSVNIQPMIYCPEKDLGMIVQTATARRNHSGPVYSADTMFQIRPEQYTLTEGSPFLMKIRQTIYEAFDENRFLQLMEQIRNARAAPINADDIPGVVRAVCGEFHVTETEQDGVLLSLTQSGEMNRYGLANAVSQYGQQVESYDRATELEGIGFGILSISDSHWNHLNSAAA